MRDEYYHNQHSVHRLTYHAVFVVKYRRKAITPEIMDQIRKYTKYLIEERLHGELLELNGEADHIHILFSLPPTATPSNVVCSLKTQLSRKIRALYGSQIRDKLWGDSFWSDSYFLTTTGGASIATLEAYIQQQGRKEKSKP